MTPQPSRLLTQRFNDQAEDWTAEFDAALEPCPFIQGRFMQVWTWYLSAFIHSSSEQMVIEHLLLSVFVLSTGDRVLTHGAALDLFTFW